MAQWAARPTTYKGIPMRSRLEARVAAELDRWDECSWTYEPRAFADEHGQYLPDFCVLGVVAETPLYVEVKPTVEAAQRVMRQMEIIWSSEPEATLSVFVPDGDDGWLAFMAYGDKNRRWHELAR